MKKITVKCFECGTSFLKWRGDVLRSKKANRPQFCNNSCRTTHIRNGSKSDYYKNYKYPITKHCGDRQDELSPFRVFVLRSKAKDRIDLYGESTISENYLKKIWGQQNGRCAYTNVEMTLPRNTKDYYKTRSMKKASLDRIDSNKGYCEGNVQFVCMAMNMAKKDFSDSDTKDFVMEIKNAGISSGVIKSGGDEESRTLVNKMSNV